MLAFFASGARSMISALRVGSPNSFIPRMTKATTIGRNEREKSNTSGKRVKKPNVATTKGFLVLLSARYATGM